MKNKNAVVLERTCKKIKFTVVESDKRVNCLCFVWKILNFWENLLKGVVEDVKIN